VLSIAIKPNDLFGLVFYQVHKTKIGGERIRWRDGETRKDISVPSLYVRKPSFTAQRRAIASYPFFDQILTNLLVRFKANMSATSVCTVSWHALHSAFCLFWDKVIGPIVGHHFDLGLLILDCFLVKMSLVVASKRVHAQGAPAHLVCHG
jgi:hypothetical protein